MLFEFSNIGRSPSDAAILPALKANGAANAEFAHELGRAFRQGDRDQAAQDVAAVREARERRDELREQPVDDERSADEAAADDELNDAQRAADADHADAADNGEQAAADDEQPTAQQHNDSDDGDVQAQVDAQAAVAAVAETTDANDGDDVTAIAYQPAETTAGEPATDKANPSANTATTADQPKAEVATENTAPATSKNEPAAPTTAKNETPAVEDPPLAALESLLGPEAVAALGEAAGTTGGTGDELPELLNMPEGFAAMSGEQTVLAHMLMKRINTLQQRLDRLQQLMHAQPNSGAQLDPATAAQLDLADDTNVSDVITGMIRQTEARLDALMSGNARAAAQPAALAADGARPAATGSGNFASHLSGDTNAGATTSSGTQNTSATAQAAQTLAARAAPPQTPAGIQVAIQLNRAVQDGQDRINIRLNPAELGRVDVKLEVGHDGRAIAVVTVDRQETLDLLQRDARGLERALQDAGLQTDSGSLSFNLRQHGQDANQTADGRAPSAGTTGGSGDGDVDIEGAEAAASDPNRLLDISV